MSARDKILTAITTNAPVLLPVPVMDTSVVTRYENVITQFITVLESIGGKVIQVEGLAPLQKELLDEMQTGKFIVNTIQALGQVDDSLRVSTAPQLAGVHKVFIAGTIGVAENGAVWVKESNMLNRLLPFICQHLVLVVQKKNIVDTMHQAYEQVNTFEEGFGAFIAGPSKTADIEQSLVIGAHGARSLVVYLLD